MGAKNDVNLWRQYCFVFQYDAQQLSEFLRRFLFLQSVHRQLNKEWRKKNYLLNLGVDRYVSTYATMYLGK